ncbi:hypothetical protein BN2537_2803 [Streptomyces venezuelae]|nr:hypothetical protein BN2537_2803 [Streptomyces venezuelae]
MAGVEAFPRYRGAAVPIAVHGERRALRGAGRAPPAWASRAPAFAETVRAPTPAVRALYGPERLH